MARDIACAQVLESRALLSAVLDNGELTITGTSGNDAITVANQPGAGLVVTLNGQAQTFADVASITRLRVTTDGGNDSIDIGTITLPESGGKGVRVTIDAGAGADTIVTRGTAPDRYFIEGGDGNDTITATAAKVDGGTGDDRITLGGKGSAKGGGGNDTIVTPRGIETTGGTRLRVSRGGGLSVIGSNNDDTIVVLRPADAPTSLQVTVNGATHVFSDVGVRRVSVLTFGGNDTVRLSPDGPAEAGLLPFDGRSNLQGGDGNDVLIGGAGRDVIGGGNGHDALDGRAGDDVLTGLDGDDTLIGGPGRDLLDAGTGNDTIFNRAAGGDDPGRDVVIGGSGLDTADVDPNDAILDVESFRPAV
jgi:Ca2+-binding RTX toxin-like protein